MARSERNSHSPLKKIALNYIGDPAQGPRLPTGRKRYLLGWKHYDDSPTGLMDGQIWAAVAGGKFQVFDKSYNRSDTPGEVRDCGVANFTMVRMFHRYWAPRDRIPRDMNWADKASCRDLYWALVRKCERESEISTISDDEVYHGHVGNQLGNGNIDSEHRNGIIGTEGGSRIHNSDCNDRDTGQGGSNRTPDEECNNGDVGSERNNRSDGDGGNQNDASDQNIGNEHDVGDAGNQRIKIEDDEGLFIKQERVSTSPGVDRNTDEPHYDGDDTAESFLASIPT